MEKENYLIFIGGSGSRVADAFVRFCDSGYASEVKKIKSAKILIVDADKSKGNSTLSEELLKSYYNCHKMFSQNGSPAFGTKIESVFMNGHSGFRDNVFRVSPVSEKAIRSFKVTDLINGVDDRQVHAFAKSIYSEYELGQNATDGFYAHPAIGSLMFSRWINLEKREDSDEAAYFKNMIAQIKNDVDSNRMVNVFVVSSIFGGTGASGFPAIIKAIKDGVNSDRVNIGGCLMLPYFSYENENGNRIKEFDLNSQLALSFYDRYKLLSDLKTLYLIGAPNKEVRGRNKNLSNDSSQVNARQDNWPHVVELFAASFICEFLNTEPSPNFSVRGAAISANTDNINDIKWSDIPDGERLQKYMERFLLMSYAYDRTVLYGAFDVCNDSGLALAPKKFSRDISPDFFKAEPFSVKSSWSVDFNKTPFEYIRNYFYEYTDWVYRLIHKFDDNKLYLSGDYTYVASSVAVNNLFRAETVFGKINSISKVKSADNDKNKKFKDETIKFYDNYMGKTFEGKSREIKPNALFRHINNLKFDNSVKSAAEANRILIGSIYDELVKFVK